jgi:hypothetical protein
VHSDFLNTLYVQGQINPVHIFSTYFLKILNHGSELHVESINGPLDTAKGEEG